MAQLLGMANRRISELNANNTQGSDSEKLYMEGISRDEFLQNVRNVDRVRSSSAGAVGGPQLGPNELPPLGPSGGAPIMSGDALILLQSINSTLTSIFQLLIQTFGGRMNAEAEINKNMPPPNENQV